MRTSQGRRPRVEIRDCLPGATFHSQNVHQVVLLCHGRLDLKIGGKSECLEKGRGALISAGDNYIVDTTATNTCLIIVEVPIDMTVVLGISKHFAESGFLPITVATDYLIEHLSCIYRERNLTDDLQISWLMLLFESIGFVRDNSGACEHADRILTRAQKFMRLNVGNLICTKTFPKQAV